MKAFKGMIAGVYRADGAQRYAQIRRTPEERVEVSRKICSKVAMGRYTLQSLCEHYNLKMQTFLKWAAPSVNIGELLVKGEPLPVSCIPEVHEMYKKACREAALIYKEVLREKSRSSLLQRIEGFEYEVITEEAELDEDEDSETFGQMVVKKRKTKKGTIAPDVAAITFALTNVDPDNFKNTSKFQQTNNTQVNVGTGLENYSDEELELKKATVIQELKAIEGPHVNRKSEFSHDDDDLDLDDDEDFNHEEED